MDRTDTLTVAENLNRFMHVTQGNPLLVEIGLSAIATGKPAASLNTTDLLNDRVRGVREALQQAGYGSDVAMRGFAAATIAGGVDGKPALKHVITDAFELHFDSPSNLARIFPAETNDLQEYLPPIRPKLVGDAFVRSVFAETSAQGRREIIAAAWAANPRGTLLTALRLGGVDSGLGAAILNEARKGVGGLSPLDVVLAFADGSIRLAPDCLPESPESKAAGALLPTTLECMSKLTSDDARALANELLMIEAGRPASAGVRWHAWTAITAGALSAAIRGSSLSDADQAVVDKFLQGVRQRTSHFSEPTKLTTDALVGLWAAVIESLGNDPKRLLSVKALYKEKNRLSLVDPLIADPLYASLTALESRFASSPEYLELLALTAYAYSVHGGIATQRIRDKVRAVTGDKPTGLIAVRALMQVTVASAVLSEPGRTSALAEVAQELWRQNPQDREVLYQLAEFWVCVAGTNRFSITPSFEGAENVERVSGVVNDDQELAELAAEAWRYAGYSASQAGNEVECRRAVDKIAALASNYPTSSSILAEFVNTSTYLGKFDKGEFSRTLRTVEAAVSLFPNNFNVQYRCAEALQYCAAETDELVERRRLAARLDELALRFLDDAAMQSMRAAVWIVVAEKAGREEAEILCHKALDILRSFDSRGSDLGQADALSVLGIICYRDDYARCRDVVSSIARLVAKYGDDRELLTTYIRSHLMLIGAASVDVRGAASSLGAAEIAKSRCFAAADRIEKLAEHLTNHAEYTARLEEVLNITLADAWSKTAWAARTDPVACRACVTKVEAVANQYAPSGQLGPLHSAIHYYLMVALRVEAWSLGYNLESHREVIEKMERLFHTLRNPLVEASQELAQAKETFSFYSRGDVKH